MIEPATKFKDTYTKNGTWALLQLDDEYSLGHVNEFNKNREDNGHTFPFGDFPKEELEELIEMLKEWKGQNDKGP